MNKPSYPTHAKIEWRRRRNLVRFALTMGAVALVAASVIAFFAVRPQ